MIGIKFLLRLIMFLVAVGVISMALVLIWYVLTKAFMWVVDNIEESNSDFAVWFKPKLRRLTRRNK